MKLRQSVFHKILLLSPLFLLNSLFLELALAQRPDPLPINSSEIDVLPVQGKIHMIATGGSNIAVMIGEQGLIVVDSGNIEASNNVIEAIQKLSALPVRYLINTSPLPSHLDGNLGIYTIGEPRLGSGEAEIGFSIPTIGHANGLTHLATTLIDEAPFEKWPNSTFFSKKKSLFLNGEPVDIELQPAAITDADLFVHFRQSDVLVAGDIFNTSSYPHFYPELGGSLQGVIDGLNRIIDIAVPEFNQQGGTLIIPGHGRLASESDVVEYRDMLTIIRDRVQIMISEGLTFEEVLAARVTLEYDPIYGYESGEWTTGMFLEAVYEDLR